MIRGLLRQHLCHGLILLGCSAYILSDQRLNLLRIIALLAINLGVVRWLIDHLLTTRSDRIHGRCLKVTRREDVVDGIHTFLLREVLLKQLGDRILHTLQIHQEVTIESLFGLRVQILVLM